MSKRKNYFRVDELEGNLRGLRVNGVKRGEWCGFDALDERYSIKRGSTTYIYAGAHQGKSQFGFEIMMNLAQYSDWKFAVYSPETGSPTEVFSELLWVYLRKPFLENDVKMATDEEVEQGMKFINEHFFIIDTGLQDLTVQGFYTAVEDIEEEYGVSIDGCMIDPFTEIKTDTSAGVRDDIAIGQILTLIRKFSAEKDMHTFVTVHTRFQQPKYKDGVAYFDKPTMNDIAGGMQWSRKGMMVMSVWRCPVGLTDSNGVPYEGNQVEITIMKAKPKMCGKLGTVTLYYDRLSNRYYELNNKGEKVFAHSK